MDTEKINTNDYNLHGSVFLQQERSVMHSSSNYSGVLLQERGSEKPRWARGGIRYVHYIIGYNMLTNVDETVHMLI